MEKYIVAMGKNKPQELFRLAKTFDDLLELNIAFLQGRIQETPYHLGPIDDETKPLVSNLISLHHARLLSLEGQPSLCTQGDWGFNEQRPYMNAWVEEGTMLKILRHVRKTPGKFFYVFANPTSREVTGNSFEKRFNVTRQRGRHDTQWELYTNLWGLGPWNLENAAHEASLFPRNILNDMWYMSLAMTVPYCTGDLEAELMTALGRSATKSKARTTLSSAQTSLTPARAHPSSIPRVLNPIPKKSIFFSFLPRIYRTSGVYY